MSGVICDHLRAARQARNAFTVACNSDSINRALRCNVRESVVTDLVVGDKVFYKRNVEDKWRGPATVTSILAKKVFVSHGGMGGIQVHAVSLVKAPQMIQDAQDSRKKEKLLQCNSGQVG